MVQTSFDSQYTYQNQFGSKMPIPNTPKSPYVLGKFKINQTRLLSVQAPLAHIITRVFKLYYAAFINALATRTNSSIFILRQRGGIHHQNYAFRLHTHITTHSQTPVQFSHQFFSHTHPTLLFNQQSNITSLKSVYACPFSLSLSPSQSAAPMLMILLLFPAYSRWCDGGGWLVGESTRVIL